MIMSILEAVSVIMKVLLIFGSIAGGLGTIWVSIFEEQIHETPENHERMAQFWERRRGR